MDRYVNFSPEIMATDVTVVDGPVVKERPRIRVARSPSDVGESADAKARAHTDLSDSSVNNNAEELGKKGSFTNLSKIMFAIEVQGTLRNQFIIHHLKIDNKLWTKIDP